MKSVLIIAIVTLLAGAFVVSSIPNETEEQAFTEVVEMIGLEHTAWALKSARVSDDRMVFRAKSELTDVKLNIVIDKGADYSPAVAQLEDFDQEAYGYYYGENWHQSAPWVRTLRGVSELDGTEVSFVCYPEDTLRVRGTVGTVPTVK